MPAIIRLRCPERVLRLSRACHKRVAATVPAARLGQPGDIADVIKFLASEHAPFVTGQIVGVNGGKVRPEPFPLPRGRPRPRSASLTPQRS